VTARGRLAILAALLTAAAAGCGQQGPLTLPPETRPIERIDPVTGQPVQPDDEQQDER
jgi:predicted small lipoprotein YifL